MVWYCSNIGGLLPGQFRPGRRPGILSVIESQRLHSTGHNRFHEESLATSCFRSCLGTYSGGKPYLAGFQVMDTQIAGSISLNGRQHPVVEVLPSNTHILKTGRLEVMQVSFQAQVMIMSIRFGISQFPFFKKHIEPFNG